MNQPTNQPRPTANQPTNQPPTATRSDYADRVDAIESAHTRACAGCNEDAGCIAWYDSVRSAALDALNGDPDFDYDPDFSDRPDNYCTAGYDGCGDQADMLDPADCNDPEFFAECEGSNDPIDVAELLDLDDSIDCSDDDVPF